jgi:hypothetical protein
MILNRCCPFHGDEDQFEMRKVDEGTILTCPRTTGHPTPGTHFWLVVPEIAGMTGMSGLSAELGLDVELPSALAAFEGRWVEYGVLEAAYAAARPKDFDLLVERYGHTAIEAKRYTASAFLARALGDLSSTGALQVRFAPATGRWRYNSAISWWTISPPPSEDATTSWASLRRSMDYVRGATEICPIGNCGKTISNECNCVEA